MLLAAPNLSAQGEDIGRTEGNFSLPRSQDEIAVWLGARKELRTGDVRAGVERLHQLWSEGSYGIVPTLGATERWQGLRHAVLRTLRDLDARGRDAYEQLVQREAGASYDRPIAELDEATMLDFARRFPASRRGIESRVRLADLAIERGDGLSAQRHLRAARDVSRPTIAEQFRLAERAAVAEAIVTGSLPQLEQESSVFDDGSLPESLNPRPKSWPAYGGGYDGASQMYPLQGQPETGRSYSMSAPGFERNSLALHPVGDIDGIVVNNGHRIYSFDALTGELDWRADGPMVGNSRYQSTQEAINPNFPLIPAINSRVAVGVLQVPRDIEGAASRRTFRRFVNIIEKLPSRRLFAFDRQTGKRLWAHWDRADGPITETFEGHDACGAPLIEGDTVYCSVHDQSGAIAFYIAAYDVYTGREKWRRLVCSSQNEVNMFGNARQEFAAAPLALKDGVVYGTTNLGICYALNAEDGEIRWLAEYETIPLPRTRLQNQRSRDVYFANNPAAITDGVVAFTPLDSSYAIGLDTTTGESLWRLRYDAVDDFVLRWQLGAVGDEFFFSGAGVLSVRARPNTPGRPYVRKVASATQLGETASWQRAFYTPRPAIAGDRLWMIGSEGQLDVLRLDGRYDNARTPESLGSGNLMLLDGVAITLRENRLSVFADLDSLASTASKASRLNPDDPHAQFRHASLLAALAGPDLSGTSGRNIVRAFERGLGAARSSGSGPGTEIYRRLERGLFQAATRRAEATYTVSPSRGLQLLAEARDSAPTAEDWLQVQRLILDRIGSKPRRRADELRRMAERYPDERFTDAEYGELPVRVFASLAGLELESDPRKVVDSCQQLIESDGDLVVRGRVLRSRLVEKQLDLIAEHSRSVYRGVEDQAATALVSAGDDRALLGLVSERFPIAEAAEESRRRLIDLSIEAGDLAAATSTFRTATEGSTATPSLLRRLCAAASKGGNMALARGLALRLRDEFPRWESDWPADEGKVAIEAIADLLAEVAVPAERVLGIPDKVLARFVQQRRSETLDIVAVERASGFGAPTDPPLLILVRNGERQSASISVQSTTNPTGDLSDERFRIPFDVIYSRQVIRAYTFEDNLVVTSPSSLRSFDLKTGQTNWSVEARNDRQFELLTVREGCLSLFSRHIRNGDGGGLLTVEATTGAVVQRTMFPVDRNQIAPTASGRSLFAIERVDDAAEIIEWDPILGSVRSRTRVRPAELKKLDLSSVELAAANPTRGLFTDGNLIFLGRARGIAGGPPRLIALEPETGRLAWSWSGRPGYNLINFGLHSSSVILVSQQQGRADGELVILNARNGSEQRPTERLGQNPAILGWSQLSRQAPSTLMIQDTAGSCRLLVLGLTPGSRSFRLDLQQRGGIHNDPILSDDFLFVPFWQSGSRVRMLVLEPGSRRRGALPEGEESLMLSMVRPVRALRQGSLIITQSPSQVTLLSDRR